MEPYLDCGRTLVTDNWYTSVGLAEELNSRSTHLVGTVNTKRVDNPEKVVNKVLRKGDVFAQQNGSNVVFLKWKTTRKSGTREILVLSTKHGDEMNDVIKRGKTKKIPEIVTFYNKGKSFIDRADQMAAYSSALRRSIKWYKKIAFDILVGTSVVNAYSLFKDVTHSKITITEFREKLVEGLFNIQPEDNDAEQITNVAHNLSKNKQRRRCQTCYKKYVSTGGRQAAQKKTPKIYTSCEKCGMYMCLKCFMIKHNISDND